MKKLGLLLVSLVSVLAMASTACSSNETPSSMGPSPPSIGVGGTGGSAPMGGDSSAGAGSSSSGRGGSAGSAESGAPAGGGDEGGGDAAMGTEVGSVTDSSVGDGGELGWPPIGDYGAHGPLATERDKNTGPGAAYDIFRPRELGGAPRHPIISWANGTLFGIDDYQALLDHWASHGFVVIAAHSQSTAGGGTHKAGIDWLVAENSRAASVYFGLLDIRAIGAAGHSQGGGATIAAGAGLPGLAGIVATLALMPILSFEADKTVVRRQTAPMFNVNATMDDRDPTGAYATQIYDGSNTELVQAFWIGIHEDAMTAPMQAPTLAWFRLHLMGDAQAKSFFYPDKTCSLCTDKKWKTVRYKNVP